MTHYISYFTILCSTVFILEEKTVKRVLTLLAANAPYLAFIWGACFVIEIVLFFAGYRGVTGSFADWAYLVMGLLIYPTGAFVTLWFLLSYGQARQSRYIKGPQPQPLASAALRSLAWFVYWPFFAIECSRADTSFTAVVADTWRPEPRSRFRMVTRDPDDQMFDDGENYP